MEMISRFFAALLLVLIGVVTMIQGEVHYHDFVLKEKNFTKVCSTKSMLVVNEQWPGPVINVRKGDTVFVNVHNEGHYGVTLHWHGVKQPRNPWSDGPAFITQCPIQPGTNFTYEVIFSDEEGTLWWHAHSNWTRQSIHGAIVIHPAEGTTFPYPTPDEEQVVILGDWYDVDVNEAIEGDLETGGFPNHDPVAYTINGEPGDIHSCSNETMYRLQVEYGKTYLLRLVNVPMDESTYFAIAGHNLTVVGTDGSYTKPIVTSYVAVGPGETMDVLITTNQSPGEYYMATRSYHSPSITYFGYTQCNATAVLQYKGNYTSTTPSFPTALPYYVDYAAGIDFVSRLRSLASEEHPVDVPKNITTRMFITVALNENEKDSLYYMAGSLNNYTWVDPTISVLEAYYSNMSGFYATDFPDQPERYFDFMSDDLGLNVSASLLTTKVKVLNYGEEVEIVFQSTNMLSAQQNHPMHLHGHAFYVVGMGRGDFDLEEDPKGYNLVDPPYQNTAILPKYGWFALRFRASNPGVWFLHCHIEHHYSYGMQTVFIVKNGGTPETSMKDPPAYMPTCGSDSGTQVLKSMQSEDYNELNMII